MALEYLDVSKFNNDNTTPDFILPNNVGASSARLNMRYQKWRFSGEFVNKINDPYPDNLDQRFNYLYKNGEGLLFNLGYSKKEVDTLVTGDRYGTAARKLEKQKKVDEAAKNFDKDNPKTWLNTLDYVGSASQGTIQFVLPTNKKIRKFILDKIKESRETTSSVFNPDFDTNLTQTAIGTLFTGRGREAGSIFEQGLKNLGMDIARKKPSQTISLQKKLRDFLNREYYTPGQKKHLRQLDEMKRILNKRSGIYFKKRGNQDKALEIEHTQAVFDVLKTLGIKPDDFIKQADPKQIKTVGDLAMKYSNLQFATRLQNRGKLSKSTLFEVGVKGEHSKTGVFTRNLEVERLRAAGKYDEADVLEQSIKNDVNEFIELRKIEAKAGLPLKFDYTDKKLGLPEYARIKSSMFYDVPERSISQQLFDIAEARGITFPNRARKVSGVMFRPSDFKPITEKQFLKLKDLIIKNI